MKVQDKIHCYERNYSGGKEMLKQTVKGNILFKVVYSNMYKIIHMQRLKYRGKVYGEFTGKFEVWRDCLL